MTYFGTDDCIYMSEDGMCSLWRVGERAEDRPDGCYSNGVCRCESYPDQDEMCGDWADSHGRCSADRFC